MYRVLNIIAIWFAVWVLATPALADVATIELNLPTQSLEKSLREVAERFDLRIAFYSDSTHGLMAPPLAGPYTAASAFARLLTGTTLEYVFVSDASVAIRPGPTLLAAPQPVLTPATTVKEPGLAGNIVLALRQVFGSTAPATTQMPQDEKRWIEEITVTAEKRPESMLRVPITMSTFSQRNIEELGIKGNEDLERLVGGLQFGFDSEGNGISMRGIGTQKASQYNADVAVAFYVDGIYTNDTYGLAPDLFDVERIEVARGPQGTLNGRNSIAGSVSYFNQKPTDFWDALLLTDLTSQPSQRYNLAFGGPLTDRLSFRVTAGHLAGDGLQENVGTGANSDAPDQQMLAAQLRYRTALVDVNLRHQQTRDRGVPRAPVRLIDPDRASPTVVIYDIYPVANWWYLYPTPVPSIKHCDPRQFRDYGGLCDDIENRVLGNVTGFRDDRSDRWALTADIHPSDILALRYTYGTTRTSTFNARDGDDTDRIASTPDPAVPADCVASMGLDACRSLEGVPFADTATAFIEHNHESSHELQLFSDFDHPFNFVAGVYHYQNQSGWGRSSANYASGFLTVKADAAATALGFASCNDYYQHRVVAPVSAGGLGLDPDEYSGCEDNAPFSGRSASGARYFTNATFLNLEWRLSESWNVAGGLRRTEDTKAQAGINGFTTIANVGGVPIRRTVSLNNREERWGKSIGHVSLEYTPDADLLFYGRISTGFRAGGFNQVSGGTSATDLAGGLVPATFRAEELVNYELGMKGRFLDRLVLMVGAFYQDFDGYHFNAVQYVADPVAASKIPDPFREYTTNIDGTKVWGLEVEGALYVGDRWRVSGFYSFLDSSVGSVQAYFYDRDAAETGTFIHRWTDPASGAEMVATLPRPRDASGNRLPQQPRHKGAVTIAYALPLAEFGSLQWLSSLSYTGDRFPNIANIAYQQLPAYRRWDMHLAWASMNDSWRVTLYARNVLNEIGIEEYAFEHGWLTDPRQIGVQVRWRPGILQ